MAKNLFAPHLTLYNTKYNFITSTVRGPPVRHDLSGSFLSQYKAFKQPYKTINVSPAL